jgi:hypothetical protein
MTSRSFSGLWGALAARSKPLPGQFFALAGTSFLTIVGLGTGANAQQAIATVTCNSSFVGGVFASDCPQGGQQLGDKLVSNFFPTPLNLTPATPSFDVKFDYTWLDPDGTPDANYGDDLWTFKVTTNQSISGTFGPFTYGYDVTITDPNWEFNQLGLDSDVPALSRQVVVVKDASDPSGSILTLTSVNGAPAGPGDFVGSYTKVTIRDTITIVPSPIGELTSVTNAWNQRPKSQVPAPLPILGAGVAFSMSRRIRKRIKTNSFA